MRRRCGNPAPRTRSGRPGHDRARFALRRSSGSGAGGVDLILRNGHVLTVDDRFRVAEAVAVTGKRITAVGKNDEVLKLRSASTRVVDLRGRTVLPGLIDSHVHALSAGLSEYRGKLPPLDSFAAIQAYIRERMKTTPKGSGSLFRARFRHACARCECL